MISNILRRPRNLLALFILAAAVVMPWSTLLNGLASPSPIGVYSAPSMTAPALEGVTLSNFQQTVNRAVGSVGITANVSGRDGSFFGVNIGCEPSPNNPGEIRLTIDLKINNRVGSGTYIGKGTCLDPSATGIKALLEKFMDENWKELGFLNRGYAGFVADTIKNIVMATLGM